MCVAACMAAIRGIIVTLRRIPQPWTRLLKWVALAGAGLAILYLIGMNVFLRTRIFRNLISSSPDDVLVEYTSAYSILPGRIHAEGLRIRGSDQHVQWILGIDRCDFRVSFLELAKRRFHASHVRGDGVTLRLRLKVGDATADHLAALPPIPGFLDPRKDIGPPPPPLTDANYDLWQIQLDDVIAERVRELWIDTLRYTGELRVEGRWLFRPVRWLDVGPARVHVRSLDIGYGLRPIATGMSGTIDATIHPFDVREPSALETLKYVLARGTHAMNELPQADVGVGGFTFDATERTSLDVEDGAAGSPVATIAAYVSALSITGPDAAKARAAAVSLKLTRSELDLTQPFGDAAFAVTLEDVETPSLHPWLALPKNVDVQSGRAFANGHFEGTVAQKSTKGEVASRTQGLSVGLSATGAAEIVARDVAVNVGSRALRGNLSVKVRSRGIHGRSDLTGTTVAFGNAPIPLPAVSKVETTPETKSDTKAETWWARAELVEAELGTVDGVHFRAHVHATARDASPAAAIVASSTSIPKWIVDAVPMNGLDAQCEIRKTPSSFEVRSLSAHGGQDTVRFEYSQHEQRTVWALLVEAGPIHAAFRSDDPGTHFALFDVNPWFNGSVARVRARESAGW
jgi:hypothetical protein